MNIKQLAILVLFSTLYVASCSNVTTTPSILTDQNMLLQRLAFASCNNEDRPQPLWKELSSSNPQLFLFLGDNVYADSTDLQRHQIATEESFQDSYSRLAENQDFVSFRKQVPILPTWDDHDYGLGDGGRENPVKDLAKKFWLNFFEIDQHSPIRQRQGIYYSKIIGPESQRVQIIMLDTRSFRSPLTERGPETLKKYQRYQPSAATDQDMLGEQQWRWLEQQLKRPAEIRIIASSIQVLAEDHGYERWGNLPLERQRLFDLLISTDARGVVFVSGDRHRGGIYKKLDVTPYPLIEVTSSSLNSPITSPAAENDRYQLGELVDEPNFGLIDIDWNSKQLIFQLKTAAQHTESSIKVAF